MPGWVCLWTQAQNEVQLFTGKPAQRKGALGYGWIALMRCACSAPAFRIYLGATIMII